MILHLILSLFHNFHYIFLCGAAGLGLPAMDSPAAGPIVDAGGDDGSGDAGGDEGDGGDSEVDSDSDVAEGDDAAGDGSDKSAKPAVKDDSKIDWRTVPQEVKSHIQEISKTNPKLANQLQNAVYTSQTFLREVPGGLKEVRALKASIDEIGGIDEARNLRGIHKSLVEEQETLDTKAREGSPEVLDNLVSIAGDGFAKLMPHAMDRWQASDPQGFQHETSKMMVAALKDGGVVADMNMAFSMLKLNTPESIKEGTESLRRVANFINEINKMAKNVPERPKVDPKIASEQLNIDNQKADLFNREFSTEFGNWRNKEMNKEISRISNGRQLSDYQMETLGQKVVDEVKNILTNDEDYMKNLRRLYDARDKGELLKFTRNRTAKLLPEATKKAFRQLFSNPGAKKAAVKKPDAKAAVAAAVAPVKGWTKVTADKAPTPDQIDSKATSFEMKFRKQAILKNGTKVYWGAQVPA